MTDLAICRIMEWIALWCSLDKGTHSLLLNEVLSPGVWVRDYSPIRRQMFRPKQPGRLLRAGAFPGSMRAPGRCPANPV
jgi:hypothetical protein